MEILQGGRYKLQNKKIVRLFRQTKDDLWEGGICGDIPIGTGRIRWWNPDGSYNVRISSLPELIPPSIAKAIAKDYEIVGKC